MNPHQPGRYSASWKVSVKMVWCTKKTGFGFCPSCNSQDVSVSYHDCDPLHQSVLIWETCDLEPIWALRSDRKVALSLSAPRFPRSIVCRRWNRWPQRNFLLSRIDCEIRSVRPRKLYSRCSYLLSRFLKVKNMLSVFFSKRIDSEWFGKMPEI